MKCDKLMQDALNLHIDPEARAALNAMRKPAISGYTTKEGVGIDINSKLMTALKKIKESHTKSIDDDVMFREETIRKLLEREGVSKGEVNASLDVAFKFLKENGSTSADMDKISIDTIIGAARTKQPKIQDKTSEAYSYANYTYNKQGLQPDNKYQVRHVLGFDRRTVQKHMEDVEGSYGWAREYIGIQPGVEGKVWRLDEIQSDLFQDKEYLENFKSEMGELGMNYTQLKKMLIVDALDQAIKHNLDKVVIPITRSTNSLVGSVKVSDAYRDLNTGILPAIRKELDRSGLKLDIKHLKYKEDGSVNLEDLLLSLSTQRGAGLISDEVEARFMSVLEEFGSKDSFNEVVFSEKDLKDAFKSFKVYEKSYENRVSDKAFSVLDKMIEEQFNPEALVITIRDKAGKSLKPLENTVDLIRFKERLSKIDTIPENTKRAISWYLDNANKEGPDEVLRTYNEWKGKYKTLPDISTLNMPTKVRWDALSVLGGLGLAEAYSKLKEES